MGKLSDPRAYLYVWVQIWPSALCIRLWSLLSVRLSVFTSSKECVGSVMSIVPFQMSRILVSVVAFGPNKVGKS